ncbi:hypothetical protein CIPAW_04G193700 [Carya illinoinensis]|uniref:Uncharacterized protein n=1 Tax=Carya illinoinensis TaxID=32201 RepID=A0A8T1QUY9_CARIL|nr:hypothetical protein CIPAW_04G193700 [Carya illinoinensis]
MYGRPCFFFLIFITFCSSLLQIVRKKKRTRPEVIDWQLLSAVCVGFSTKEEYKKGEGERERGGR